MPRDLIVFGEDWGGLPSSTQHLVKHLAANRKILWVNSIGLRRPQFTGRDISRAAAKLRNKLFAPKPLAAGRTQLGDNISVVNPITLPAPRHPLERMGAAKMLECQLKPAIKKCGLQQPVLWLSLPTAVDMIGRLGESRVVYYCGDDFSSLAGVDHHTVSQRENSLVAQSDLIIAASQRLSASLPASKTHTLLHGVDFPLFSQPAPRAADLPDDGHPIAGFYGSLSSWLDTKLLAAVVRALPHWRFVFIGREEADMSRLKSLANCFFLGAKAHHELPRYSQHWQASLLPFLDNAQIKSCNPLKLYEYLATGRPIVSTVFPALQPFRELVQSARTAQDFAQALELSLHLQSVAHYPAVLQAQVADKTWQAKSEQVSQWLAAL